MSVEDTGLCRFILAGAAPDAPHGVQFVFIDQSDAVGPISLNKGADDVMALKFGYSFFKQLNEGLKIVPGNLRRFFLWCQYNSSYRVIFWIAYISAGELVE